MDTATETQMVRVRPGFTIERAGELCLSGELVEVLADEAEELALDGRVTLMQQPDEQED